MMKYNLVSNLSEFKTYAKTKDLSYVTLQSLDFTNHSVDWKEYTFKKTVFLGCTFEKEDFSEVLKKGGYIFPKFEDLPYKPYRKALYHWKELMNGYSEIKDESTDYRIYQHYMRFKRNPPMYEALAQRIHDNSIDEALRKQLELNDLGQAKKKVVGFMGGHGVDRGSEYYVKVALAAKWLSKKGYYVVTGGGPGIMEAANLGAYLCDISDDELLDVVYHLAEAPHYKSDGYITKAEEIVQKYPKGQENLAIPTWFYGHEPSNLFATSIAKYFSNSIREDTLLAISLYGVVYAPGSAGTTQEIFQEAAQNHYGTYGYYSPMIFLGKKRYIEDTSLYSTVHQLAVGKEYKKLLYLTDDPKLIENFIEMNPPIKVEE